MKYDNRQNTLKEKLSAKKVQSRNAARRKGKDWKRAMRYNAKHMVTKVKNPKDVGTA